MKSKIERVDEVCSELLTLMRVLGLSVRLLWLRLQSLVLFLHLGFQRWIIGMPTAQCWEFIEVRKIESLWYLKKNIN
jgi:hypothetical protein